MTFMFALAPLIAGAYLIYSWAIGRQVKYPVYSGQNRRYMKDFSYVVLGLTLLLLLYFIFAKDVKEIALSLALCITALIAVRQFRVIIGDNGVYTRLQFHPWSEFEGFRWKKVQDKGYWILYLYKAHSVDIFAVSVPEPQVSRLDLILKNKIGMQYQNRT